VSAPGTPIVIDTDPGIDDALALLLAARWPKCDLRVVTATYGNHTLDTTTRNARHVLERAGGGTLVLQGADRPLTRDLITAKETHGDSGLGDHALSAAPHLAPSPSALRDALVAARDPVTLVTLGPLKTLGRFAQRTSDIAPSTVRQIACERSSSRRPKARARPAMATQ